MRIIQGTDLIDYAVVIFITMHFLKSANQIVKEKDDYTFCVSLFKSDLKGLIYGIIGLQISFFVIKQIDENIKLMQDPFLKYFIPYVIWGSFILCIFDAIILVVAKKKKK